MKKISILFLSGVMGTTCFVHNAYTFLGNSHYYISELVLDKLEKNEEKKYDLTQEEKQAFLSGTVLADIGRFNFDKKININSDSEEFVLNMIKLAENSNEKWFAYGALAHCVQDENASEILQEFGDFEISELVQKFGDIKVPEDKVSQIKGLIKYGKAEQYFLDKKQKAIYCDDLMSNFDFEETVKEFEEFLGKQKIDEFKNLASLALLFYYLGIDTNKINIYSDLVKKTYKEYNLELLDEEINKQCANIVAVSAILELIIGKMDYIENTENNTDLIEETKNIKNQKLDNLIEKLVDKCIEKLESLNFEIKSSENVEN